MSSLRLANWERVVAEEVANLRGGSPTLNPWIVQCYDSVDSTMSVARDFEFGSDEQLLILAECQLSGRGRQGRVWDAAQVGMYATYGLRTERAIEDLVGFSLVVGLSVQEALDSLGAATRLKWPNDILSQEGKKLAGILIELLNNAGSTKVLVGIGANLVGSPSAQPNATDLKSICGVEHPPALVAARIASVLLQDWRLFLEHGFGYFQERWNRAAAYLGDKFVVDLGDTRVAGINQGVDSSGRLLLRSGADLHKVSSGHVLEISSVVGD